MAERPLEQKSSESFIKGIALTFIIAIAANLLVKLPIISVVGPLVLAILIGMATKASLPVPTHLNTGITFASKKLLRLGIILLGFRLNLSDIAASGTSVIVLAVVNIVFTLLIVYAISTMLKVDRNVSLLTACGTAICGAAAIVAIAAQMKAKDEETVVSVATIAVLGTGFTIMYTLLFPFLGLSSSEFGLFAGATLHEVAHVVAAAAPGGAEAVDMAVLAKLTRVLLLVPVAIIVGLLFNKSDSTTSSEKQKLPIPWFIVGFLAVSVFHTFVPVSQQIVDLIMTASYTLLAMAMAGLGLNISMETLKKYGLRPLAAGLAGSVLLSIVGFMLVKLLV
ncbi:YeiH family protein [Bacillus sp. HMF5848]|uniref:YeiH family protein n=1 Tax=Bacillus sp. HMF5848 TaxID=2495421 RepID=UPI0021AE14D6|nr:putative sulfate exporter family transporter [Bacillus sp. HMF5848]